MTKLLLLGLEIGNIVFRWFHFDGHPLGNSNSVPFETLYLFRVIGKKPHFFHADVGQYLRAYTVITQISGKTEGYIRLYRVVTLRPEDNMPSIC